MTLNPEKGTSCSNLKKPFVWNLHRKANSLGWIPYMSLGTLGNKGRSFTDLGLHKQDDREKDELLMFFHFTLWTFHSGN